MTVFSSMASRASLVALMAAIMAAGCASVNLDQRYEPPAVRMPSPPPAAATAPAAVSQPVAPSNTMGQPLPPVGTAPGTPMTPSAAAAQQQGAVPSPLVTLTTFLDGTAVTPPTRSAASGQLDALYDRQSRLLRWKTSWSNLSGPITSVQFYGPADMGQNGPAAMMWPGPFGPTYEGRATLTPQQANDLLAGLWYVSVATAAYPSGEVRGQLHVVN